MKTIRCKRWIREFRLFVLAAILGIAVSVSAQQDVRTELFQEANQALSEARNNQADVLSPKNFETAMDYYTTAEKDYSKNKNLENIRQNLNACVSYCQLAVAAAETAQSTLPHAIKARADAIKADAATFSPKDWQDAEAKFIAATRDLEAGNRNSAIKRAGDAEALYRKAELAAIKENYLRETWELLEQADDRGVKKYAPTTLARSQTLLAEAERELNENRYDTDTARSLAIQAKYEAKHSLYLAETVKKLRDDKDLLEEQLLAAEVPLQRIADKLAIQAAFDQGLDGTTAEIVEAILALQDSSARLQQDVIDYSKQLELAQSRIAELEEKLGGIEKEKSELAKQMEANEKIRAQFVAVEKLFDREEANVLRKGDNVIVRLIGLTFAVGKSTIDPSNFALLSKLQQAIQIFPDCTVDIDGHTDSHGGDDMNYKLSQDRAESVRQYLIANMDLSASQINATGYGETRPIATNETAEGRSRNRRIDVVIHPAL